jgi:hypothetical protein
MLLSSRLLTHVINDIQVYLIGPLSAEPMRLTLMHYKPSTQLVGVGCLCLSRTTWYFRNKP